MQYMSLTALVYDNPVLFTFWAICCCEAAFALDAKFD
jgi:hypothetical protein